MAPQKSINQILGLVLGLLSIASYGQLAPKEDFSSWGWIQVEKQTFKHQYVSLQYQVRYDNYGFTFDRSNFYLGYGIDYFKKFNTEVVYQYSTSVKKDEHTFFIGTTYKTKLFKKTSLFFRTAVQHTQNYFTGDPIADKPITEWRNRIRLSYSITKKYAATISAEPYLAYDRIHPGHLSRIRYVSQLNYKFNKYNNVSLFYLVEPDVITYKTPKTDYVIGLSYSIKLPNKWKDFKKFYKPSNPDKDKDSDTKDSFN